MSRMLLHFLQKKPERVRVIVVGLDLCDEFLYIQVVIDLIQPVLDLPVEDLVPVYDTCVLKRANWAVIDIVLISARRYCRQLCIMFTRS